MFLFLPFNQKGRQKWATFSCLHVCQVTAATVFTLSKGLPNRSFRREKKTTSKRSVKNMEKLRLFQMLEKESLTWHHPQTLHLQSLQGMTWDDMSKTSHAAIKSASEITVTSLTYHIHLHSPASAFSSWRISSSKSRFLGLTKGGGTGANCLGKANGLASLPENSELVHKEKMYIRSVYTWCGNESIKMIRILEIDVMTRMDGWLAFLLDRSRGGML